MTTRLARLSPLLLAVAAALLLALAACGGGSDGVPVEPPVITTQPVAATVGLGQPASFLVQVTGTPPLTYQWRRNGTAIPGATSAGLSIAAAAVEDDGATYSVVVENAAGRVTSASATLTVVVQPLVITAQPVDVTVTVGQPATFSVAATAGRPISYAWRRFDAFIDGATAATYTTPPTTMADNGAMFSVAVSDGANAVLSVEVRLWVVR